MGQPTEASKINGSYNWGEFGSANQYGVNLSNVANDSIRSAQGGINQYVKELINPSYNNESFRARQELLDASNRQYANQLGANAIARGARGSTTQNILNSIMANRNNDMRNAMLSEDARIANVLSALSGVEGNYFNQANTMGNNILQRLLENQNIEVANTNAYNQWRNNLISGAASIVGAVFGGPAGAALAKGAADTALEEE